MSRVGHTNSNSAFRSVHSTLGVHCNNKEVKLMAIPKDIGTHQYLDDWLVRAGPHLVSHTQELVKICQELGWLVNLGKSELEPRQIFVFCRLPVRPQVQHRTVGRTIRTKYWKYCHYRLIRSGSSCL